MRKSALGQLKGEQASRVVCGGKEWVKYEDFTHALGDNGIDMGDDDLLLLLVQLGSSIDGVVHAKQFASTMDRQMVLATHAAYAKIEGALWMEGVTLGDAVAKLDERGEGFILHGQLVELLHTFEVGLPNEDLTMLLARLDRRNSGKIDASEFLADVAKHRASEHAWSKVSDALGPSGGAQLGAFVTEGTALATSALLAALRQLGVDVSDAEFDAIASLDLLDLNLTQTPSSTSSSSFAV